MPPAAFEPAIPAGERPKTHSLDRAATGLGKTHSLDRAATGLGIQVYSPPN